VKRLLLVAFVVLAVAPAAQAKGPFQVCGASGCTVLAQEAQIGAMPLRVFELPDGTAASGPAAPAPYYVIRFADFSNAVAYWLPSASLLRVSQNGGVVWRPTLPNEEAFLRDKTAGLAPYPTPSINHVLVDYERVKRPTGYAQLLTMGAPRTTSPTAYKWLDVWLSGPVSPWTDGTVSVAIARTGSYLLRNGVVFAIPKTVADRVRKRLPLG
jgi:hypothetical protein